MIDLKHIFRTHCQGATLSNFYKSVPYKSAHAYLTSIGVPENEIIVKTRSAINIPVQIRAHRLIGVAMLQWANPHQFNKTLNDVLNRLQSQAPTPPTP